MKRFQRPGRSAAATALVLIALLDACATSGPRIVTSHDPAADFSQFRTFSFATPLATDLNGTRTSVSVQLMVAATRVLEARDLRPTSVSPDLLIDFYVAEESRATGSSVSVSSSPFVHAHGGLTTWSGYDLGTSSRHRITEGMVIVDVIDARRGALIFEGRAEDRITESMRDNLEETIAAVVAEIFSAMP